MFPGFVVRSDFQLYSAWMVSPLFQTEAPCARKHRRLTSWSHKQTKYLQLELLFNDHHHSFAQWHYRSQWGLSETRLLLIENFSQYPARRLEYRRLCNFWRPNRGPHTKRKKAAMRVHQKQSRNVFLKVFH